MIHILNIYHWQSKTSENPKIIDIKSVTIEPSKTSYELFKTKKVCQVSGANKNSTSPLYSETKKTENFFDE